MKVSEARRLVDLFYNNREIPSSKMEEKLAITLELALMRELGEEICGQSRGGGVALFRHDRKKWIGSEKPADCRGYRYHGAASAYGSSPPGIHELNYYGMFQWEATEFILSLWTVDLLLCMKGGKQVVIHAYTKLKALGFQEVFARTDSQVAFFFDDPEIWNEFDENAVVDGGYYLYSVLTGIQFPAELSCMIEEGVNFSYYNSFLGILLRDFLFIDGKALRKYHFSGWMRISDPVVRKALMSVCSVYGCMDCGESCVSVLLSPAIGNYLSGVRMQIDSEKREVLDRALEVLLTGRGEGEFEHGGLGPKWPCRVTGFSKSCGAYLSVCAFQRDLDTSPWVRHASAFFHLLYDKWSTK